MDKEKKKARCVLFWIKSSRGTDDKVIFEIPSDWNEEDVKSALERWCSGFGAWTNSENVVRYGSRPINVFDKKELKRRYDLVCKSRARINEKWKILAAMFSVRKLA